MCPGFPPSFLLPLYSCLLSPSLFLRLRWMSFLVADILRREGKVRTLLSLNSSPGSILPRIIGWLYFGIRGFIKVALFSGYPRLVLIFLQGVLISGFCIFCFFFSVSLPFDFYKPVTSMSISTFYFNFFQKVMDSNFLEELKWNF